MMVSFLSCSNRRGMFFRVGYHVFLAFAQGNAEESARLVLSKPTRCGTLISRREAAKSNDT